MKLRHFWVLDARWKDSETWFGLLGLRILLLGFLLYSQMTQDHQFDFQMQDQEVQSLVLASLDLKLGQNQCNLENDW